MSLEPFQQQDPNISHMHPLGSSFNDYALSQSCPKCQESSMTSIVLPSQILNQPSQVHISQVSQPIPNSLKQEHSTQMDEDLTSRVGEWTSESQLHQYYQSIASMASSNFNLSIQGRYNVSQRSRDEIVVQWRTAIQFWAFHVRSQVLKRWSRLTIASGMKNRGILKRSLGIWKKNFNGRVTRRVLLCQRMLIGWKKRYQVTFVRSRLQTRLSK